MIGARGGTRGRTAGRGIAVPPGRGIAVPPGRGRAVPCGVSTAKGVTSRTAARNKRASSLSALWLFLSEAPGADAPPRRACRFAIVQRPGMRRVGYPGVERYSIVRRAQAAIIRLTFDLVKILLSNDDGYRAEGLQALKEAIISLGAVTVVAPDRNRSGASNSLTLDVPIRAARYDADSYYVNGTPTDCVHLAISGLFDFEFDLVVSGVNDGANLGDDTLYSGTVAAAVEGRFLGLPAIAVSLCVEPGSPRNFAGAARVAASLVQRLSVAPLQGPVVLNVNVPDLPDDQLLGIRVTRLGARHRSKPIVKVQDPRGRNVYWVGNAGDGQDAGPGTDFHAVAHGFVSVTPLQIDLTRHAALPELERWLST
jgi:5'-nucleotidase